MDQQSGLADSGVLRAQHIRLACAAHVLVFVDDARKVLHAHRGEYAQHCWASALRDVRDDVHSIIQVEDIHVHKHLEPAVGHDKLSGVAEGVLDGVCPCEEYLCSSAERVLARSRLSEGVVHLERHFEFRSSDRDKVSVRVACAQQKGFSHADVGAASVHFDVRVLDIHHVWKHRHQSRAVGNLAALERDIKRVLLRRVRDEAHLVLSLIVVLDVKLPVLERGVLALRHLLDDSPVINAGDEDVKVLVILLQKAVDLIVPKLVACLDGEAQGFDIAGDPAVPVVHLVLPVGELYGTGGGSRRLSRVHDKVEGGVQNALSVFLRAERPASRAHADPDQVDARFVQ
mmetsp:Transcript_2780/g.10088  ORF Transcript_2780/g.10088 Transcript_2780/m.10088 type:complete len:344 (+) Transcript_2780:487-1518(+)